MRTLDAINAGYDEITHIYFATMQAMPQEVVDKANDLMVPVLGAATARKLIDALLTIDSVKDIRTLRPLLQI